MIEVVYKGESSNEDKNTEVKVPKNVRQIGDVNTNRKIYVEDYVMTYLKNNIDNVENVKYGVLLGKIRQGSGNTYIFVKGLAEAHDVIENSLIFNDEIWTGIYQDIKSYFDTLEIVGWFVSLPYRVKDDMSPIRKLHLDNFAGNDKVCYLEDRSENEDGFYIFDNGNMERQGGYYIYYEKNPNMQRYIEERNSGAVHVGEKAVTKNERDNSLIRRVINMTPGFLKKQNEAKADEVKQTEINQGEVRQSQNDKEDKKTKQMGFRDIVKEQRQSSIKPGYAVGTIAVIALLLSAVAMMNNYGELKTIRNSLEEIINESKAVAVINTVEDNDDTETDANSEISSETTTENFESETTADTDDTNSNIIESSSASTETTENSTEATTETNLTGTGTDTYEDTDSASSSTTSNSYCIVEAGQTLYDISMTYYNTGSMVDEIKEANDIDDDYTIYEGQKIILP